MWIRILKQYQAKLLTVPEKEKRLWRNKLTNTLAYLDIFTREKTNCNLTKANLYHKPRPHFTKYLLMFQYETTIDAFNIKITNVMNPLQEQCTLTPG